MRPQRQFTQQGYTFVIRLVQPDTLLVRALIKQLQIDGHKRVLLVSDWSSGMVAVQEGRVALAEAGV